MASIIFDFDGTIADSFDYFAHFLAGEARLLPLSEEQLSALRGLSLMATARHLGHSWWRLPGLYYAGRYWMSNYVTELEAFRGIPTVIKHLHENGNNLFIVSSNSPANIEAFLAKHGIRSEFAKIYGNVGFGGKTRILKRVVRRHHLSKHKTYYVCDEPRDVRAARKAGIHIVGVTWGYSSAETMQPYKPTFVADKPEQLLEIFQI